MARYDLCRFWSTHNSYDGLDGNGNLKGTLATQLAGNVRCLELDLWDSDYAQFGDYRLGHLKAGDGVALGGGAGGQNPRTLLFADWLTAVKNWSDAKAGAHAPITLVLDLKSDLTDNAQGGDLEDLNATLEDVLGDALFTRDDFDATPARQWPEVDALEGRFITVLSGDSASRLAYRYCFGAQPALAANASGDVVLAYPSPAGDMRCWSGRVKPRDGRVDWRRKGTYGFDPNTVSEPSLAVTDDGFVVSVHRIGPRPGEAGPALLECQVGAIQDDGRIAWGEPDTFGAGLEPGVSVVSPNRLVEVHKTPSGKSLRQRAGTLDRARKRVSWGDAAPAAAPLPRDVVAWKGHDLRCLTNALGMVLCAVDGAQRPVQHRQLAFVELQSGEERRGFVDPLFFSATAAEKDAIAAARAAGMVARGYWFRESDRTQPPTPPQENMAATDEPQSPWYAAYMADGGQAVS